MYTSWDVGDSTNRYLDKSALTTWYEDVYAPFGGQDRESTPSYLGAAAEQLTNHERFTMPVTALVERALRDNVAIQMMLWFKGNTTAVDWKPSLDSDRPTIDFYFFYPVEDYKDDGSGNLDLTATIDDNEGGEYYLGAVERGQTGTAIKCHFRNYSGATQHIERFDDHPEHIDPFQSVAGGTGNLDYIVLLDAAVSQKYEVVFYSGTEYEVRATAWRDNQTGLHPQINADADWRKDIFSTFTAPEGGLVIPPEAWQPGTLVDDEFETAVRGNTTNTDWPTDSNQQVEMAKDDNGSPDSDTWRPIKGRREKLTGPVTVDAATKFFPTRRIAPTDWPVGRKALVHDQDNIDEGTINSTQEAALGSITFSGSGLNDMSHSGNYNGNEDRVYRVKLSATGTPDSVDVSNDDGATWLATGVAITGSAQLIEDGVYFTFAATTGHTIDVYWKFDADTWGIELTGLSAGSNSYVAGAIVATTLPFRSVSAVKYTTVSEDSGVSESPSSRLYVTTEAQLTVGDTLFIQKANDPDTYEEGVIDTDGVHTGYVDLQAGLENDYTEGDFVTVKGSGEAAYWLRPVANSITDEELKRFRLNARML